MISIVIPAYNAAATVGRCLDSLLAQTYRDFELIVVDDGSTDSTAQIISAYAERDSRIRLIRQENAGVSAARNVGLDAARGDLIGFTDSDDAISPEFLEALLPLYAPGVLPVADIERSDGDGSALASLPPAITLDPTRLPEDYFCGTLGQGIAFTVCNKLFSAALLRDACLRFAEELSVGEDMLFVFRYLRRCREVCFTRRAVYRYNIAENSAMQSRRDYTGAYETVLRTLRRPDGDFPPIAEKVLAMWALESCVFILTNPAVSEQSNAAFSAWWEGFTRTGLYRAAAQATDLPDIRISRARRVLLRLMRGNRTRSLHTLLRAFRKSRTFKHTRPPRKGDAP